MTQSGFSKPAMATKPDLNVTRNLFGQTFTSMHGAASLYNTVVPTGPLNQLKNPNLITLYDARQPKGLYTTR